MEPTQNNIQPVALNEATEVKETEWCEYSGMPSPAYYLKEEETDENENNSHTNLS